MTRADTLRGLESILESFLERVVMLKENKLNKLDGLNRLDDIARLSSSGKDMATEVGDWFAAHSDWLAKSELRPSEAERMNQILQSVKNRLGMDNSVPAISKIHSEIDRWSEATVQYEKRVESSRKISLKRGPETAEEATSDSISIFDKELSAVAGLWKDAIGGKDHILSALDDALKSAELQKSNEALLLSAFIIYSLRCRNYKVEPYVKRLKKAEQAQAEDNRKRKC